jgi:mono/diheme cytochrome c family protein
MRWLVVVVVVAVLAGCATPERPTNTRGRELAQHNCGSCHAVGLTGDSPAPEAPPFRTLSRNYRVDNLQEALAEGISVGHPAMPQFQFAPEDVDALIAYLQSIQEDNNAS